MSPTERSWADAGLVYCAVVWGATFYMVKDALSGVDPLAMVAHRFLLAALLLSPWALRRPALARRLKESAILAAILFLLYAAQTVGLGHTSASNSGFITGLFVIFVPAFLLVFRGRLPTGAQWASSALALAGLWLLTGGISTINFGDAITMVAAATYALHLLATDRCARAGADPVALAFHQFWMTGTMAAAATVLMGRSFAVGTPRAAGIVAFLAAVPTVSAFFIQIWAQKFTAPTKASLIFSLEPVFAALFAWTLGGEAFVPARAAGGGLIVAAMTAEGLAKLAKGRERRGAP